MYPTITLGPVTLVTYRVVYTLMFIIGGLSIYHRLRAGSMPARVYERDLPLALLGVGVSSYAASIVLTLSRFVQTGQFQPVIKTSYFGALMGIALASWFVFRQDVPGQLGRVADLVALPLPLLQAIGRVACLGAGCCYGKHTEAWPGMFLRNSHGEWAMRYPTQIMSGLINVLVFLALIVVEWYGLHRARRLGLATRIWPFDGFIGLLYVNLFCVERFTLEFVRADSILVSGPFSQVHLTMLAGWLVTLGLIVRVWRRQSESQ
jgi:phosphatidylglycerol---prolipoprotein diacylglyceryl transferase